MKNLTLSLVLAGTTLFSVGCADDVPIDELNVSCDGERCDAFDSIRALISDAKKLDLGDLLVLSAGYATDGLNDALDVTDYASVELRPTEFYALKELVDQDLTLNDIDELVSGLAARFGENELSTEVNRVRAAYLRDSTNSDKYFAESAFKVGANLSPSWNFSSDGLTEDSQARSTIGFNAGADIEARVIAAYEGELSGVRRAPLAAIKASRGFIFPTKIEDVRAMGPGESFALKGSGTMGMNIGAGVPILVTEPTSFLTYRVVLTAGLRSQLSGEMDVQLVRLEGDEVVVDVGMEVASVKSARIGLKDGWGIHGLLEQHIDIAGIDIDLGKLVEKALQKELNLKLNLISAEISGSKKVERLSVARMRFNLNDADPEGAREEALAQALKGDLRLAQALANRNDSGVRAEFDLLRSGVATASKAGVEIFGMHFFTSTEEASGTATIQSPGGATSLIFESLNKEGGWFFESHGYGRTGLAGLIYDAAGGPVVGETNLFVAVQEGDEHMERDKMIDHLDGLIVSLGGKAALEAMEVHTNLLERYVWETCPMPNISYSCNESLIESDATMAAKQNDARSALRSNILDLDVQTQTLLHNIGELKIAAQSLQDIPAQLVGPSSSIVLDFRLDDAALQNIFGSNTGSDLQERVLDFLEATQIDRINDTNLSATKETIRTRLDDSVKPMVEIFDTYRERYLRLLSLEDAKIAGFGNIGANAVEVRFQVDNANRPNYESAVTQSLAQARSRIVTGFYDDLLAQADDVDSAGSGPMPHSEQIVAYGLLGLTTSTQLDIRVDIDVDTSGCLLLCGAALDRYDFVGYEGSDSRAKGVNVMPIGGGLFNIDSIIDIK